MSEQNPAECDMNAPSHKKDDANAENMNDENEQFDNISEFWDHNLGPHREKKNEWYKNSVKYWEGKTSDLNGVMDGSPDLSEVDLQDSLRLLKSAIRIPANRGGPPTLDHCLDCGAGIGRVSSGVLLKVFKTVDILEPASNFFKKAKECLPTDRVTNFYNMGLEEFEFPSNTYDCIWLQWCLLYITDEDLMRILLQCQASLKSNGIIVVKENVVMEGEYCDDKTDSSITRTDTQYLEFFKKCNLRVMFTLMQNNFPQHYFPVKMYCLRPKK